MRKKKKPKFSPYLAPWPPQKPRKTIAKYEDVAVINVSNYGSIAIPNIEGATDIAVEVRDDYENSHTVELRFFKQTEIVNDKYEQQLATYKEEMVEYRKLKREWKKLKAEHDIAEAARLKNHRRGMYEKLKKEFDGENQNPIQ